MQVTEKMLNLLVEDYYNHFLDIMCSGLPRKEERICAIFECSERISVVFAVMDCFGFQKSEYTETIVKRLNRFRCRVQYDPWYDPWFVWNGFYTKGEEPFNFSEVIVRSRLQNGEKFSRGHETREMHEHLFSDFDHFTMYNEQSYHHPEALEAASKYWKSREE